MEVLWLLSSLYKINTFALLEINCKINSLGVLKSPYFVHKYKTYDEPSKTFLFFAFAKKKDFFSRFT